jgi:hypothetical protein
MTADNDWLRSVRRETWFRLRVRTTRWPLASDSHCGVDQQIATPVDDRVRLIVRKVEEIGPTECVG